MSEPFVGEIRMFAGNYAPQDWALCNGALLAISENELLYSLLGTTYGGDGKTNFALPDLRGRLPIGQGQSVFGTNYVFGAKGGEEKVTLQQKHLPIHTHFPVATAAPASSAAPAGNLMAKSVNSLGGSNQDVMYLKQDAPLIKVYDLASSAITSTGDNQAHDNIMPCIAINFIIAKIGLYPTFS